MKVDYVLTGAYVYQTYNQRFEKMDIAVTGEKFYAVSPVLRYEDVPVFDYSGKYIIPGMIDIHMHIESSMTYPNEFSRIVLPYGVTTVVADPHEIANVFGIEGIRSFMEQKTEMDIFYGIPSSVPATNESLETSGAEIGEAEVKELLKDKRIKCLGEVMNFRDLSSEEDTLIKRIIKECRNHGELRIEGHCPGLKGEDCQRFIFEGVDADHTQQTPESVLEKIRLGMFLELQLKSLTPEVIKTVEMYQLYEFIALVTDDTMPDHLMEGHLNRIVKHAVEHGMPVGKAIYCSTYTPARRMHLDDRGMIAPGKLADFAVYENLEDWKATEVYKNGRKVRKPEENESVNRDKCFSDCFYHSIKCAKADKKMFELWINDKNSEKVFAHVIKTSSFGNATKHEIRELRTENGKVCWQEAGLCLAAVFERHGKNGHAAYGLVDCALKKRGAIATTWSHDSHNLLVLGTSPEDMEIAQNEVIDMQGGYVTVSEGRVTARAPLPIGGIISAESVEVLAEQLKKVRAEIERMGYQNNNVIMSISTLTLLVSPELKISDKGLIDVRSQKQVPLLEIKNSADERA